MHLKHIQFIRTITEIWAVSFTVYLTNMHRIKFISYVKTMWSKQMDFICNSNTWILNLGLNILALKRSSFPDDIIKHFYFQPHPFFPHLISPWWQTSSPDQFFFLLHILFYRNVQHYQSKTDCECHFGDFNRLRNIWKWFTHTRCCVSGGLRNIISTVVEIFPLHSVKTCLCSCSASGL